MITVNSLSGGKSSAYLAAHYAADIDLFALVCVDDHNAGRDIDKKIIQLVNDKLEKYCPQYPAFRATTEDPKVLQAMFDLEQHIGREITWVRGLSWEAMLEKKNAIPNQAKRFCTTILKIIPIFEYLYKYHSLPVAMRIGYRKDEMERKDSFTNTLDYPFRCERQRTSQRWIQRWTKINWRTGQFPLIDDNIYHHTVAAYWKDKLITFPPDSNCQNCFWKQPQQLRKNFDTNKPIMSWAGVMEVMYQHTFKKDYSLFQIMHQAIQQDFQFGTGAGCQAGFCTD